MLTPRSVCRLPGKVEARVAACHHPAMDARNPITPRTATRDAKTTLASLLGEDDPPPYRFLPGASEQLLLLCDHAAQTVPRALAGLGLARADLDRHIAWDAHAAELTRQLAQTLQAPAFLHGCSRLVVDANRFYEDPSCFPEVSDGTVIPGNRGLDRAAREQRWQQLHQPYHRAIGQWLDQRERAGRVPAIVSVHTFTPALVGQAPRPWPVGVLWNRDGRLARPFMAAMRDAGVLVGDNEPYSGRDGFGYTMAVHAEGRGLPHLLIEVRQDLFAEAAGRRHWADRLAQVLQPLLARPDLYRHWQPDDEADGRSR